VTPCIVFAQIAVFAALISLFGGVIYPTSFKVQAGGKGKQTGSIHQYVTRLAECSQRTCGLNE